MMVVLTAKNLGERQRELKQKVAEAASKNLDFSQLRDAGELSDIDRLFKIDVASKYKNVDYILDVLKSGDPLYISRALKCDWLFTDEYSNIINEDYLHQNVFPFMSSKMKKKFLTTISIHVRNEKRAAGFYTYSRNAKLDNIAFKFLLFTSECFKLQLLLNKSFDVIGISSRTGDYTKQFIQNSFDLAYAYLVRFERSTDEIIYELRYLYSVSPTKYLDLLEKFDTKYNRRFKQFGPRLSKEIVTKHKERILKNPRTYIKIIKANVLVKHSTADDAKIYIQALLPEEDYLIWDRNFYATYKYIIDLIPLEVRFEFVKKVFNDKYPNKPFETTLKFYDFRFFEMMTPETREAWALRHVESELELLGAGNDYIWYKFISFEKAFIEIKKFIMITPDKEKRLNMVHVLIASAKNQRELEKLFNYFYERHVNELRPAKEYFVNKVIHQHDPLRYDENCWTSFNKILYSLEVYSVTSHNNSRVEHRTLALIYHIIKKIELPEALLDYMDSNLNFYVLISITSRLAKEEEEMVYQYLFDYYMNKLNNIYKGKAYDEKVKHEARKYIHSILSLLIRFNKTKSDCPETVMTLIKLDWDEFKFNKMIYEDPEIPKRITQDMLIRYLKKDATVAVDKLPELKDIIETQCCFQLNLLLRKLKVYYPNDLAKTYFDFFNELLSRDNVHPKTAQIAVYGIFQLADDDFKAEFMQKHAPLETKIDHTNIDENLLHTQQAICAYACMSRPPVPLKNVLMYIKGDYLKHCLPMFNSYLAKLPPRPCMEFVASILDAPLSVQKHGLRLAFVCSSTDNLVQLITSAWKRTKNVSLRMVIYQSLFNKILEEDKDNQIKLYKPLKAFTLDLHEDDDDVIFQLLTSDKLPKDILGDYIETAWITVSKLSSKTNNLQRIDKVLRCIPDNMKLIRKELIEVIIDEHIKAEFAENPIIEEVIDQEAIKEKLKWIDAINTTKWNITAKYVTYIESDDELPSKIKITKNIIESCMEKWNEVHDNRYSIRKLCLRLIQDLDAKSYYHDEVCYKYTNILLENVLKMFQNKFTVEEIYTLIWQLNFNIIARKVIIEGNAKMSNVTNEDDIIAMVRETGIYLANEFGLLLQEFIKKEIYYVTFFEEIECKLKCTLERVINAFRRRHTKKIDNTDFRVIVCFGLMQLKTPATDMFALKLCPLDYDGCYVEDYKNVLIKLKNVEDKEFHCLVHHKFVNSDFTCRKFWQ